MVVFMYINYSIREILDSSNELQSKIDTFKLKQLKKRVKLGDAWAMPCADWENHI